MALYFLEEYSHHSSMMLDGQSCFALLQHFMQKQPYWSLCRQLSAHTNGKSLMVCNKAFRCRARIKDCKLNAGRNFNNSPNLENKSAFACKAPLFIESGTERGVHTSSFFTEVFSERGTIWLLMYLLVYKLGDDVTD